MRSLLFVSNDNLRDKKYIYMYIYNSNVKKISFKTSKNILFNSSGIDV